MGDAFRQNDETFLEAPTEQDLSRRLAILGRERLEQWVISTCGANKRRVSLEDDTTLSTPLDDVRTSKPWVKLHLVDAQNTSVARRLFLKTVSVKLPSF